MSHLWRRSHSFSEGSVTHPRFYVPRDLEPESDALLPPKFTCVQETRMIWTGGREQGTRSQLPPVQCRHRWCVTVILSPAQLLAETQSRGVTREGTVGSTWAIAYWWLCYQCRDHSVPPTAHPLQPAPLSHQKAEVSPQLSFCEGLSSAFFQTKCRFVSVILFCLRSDLF